MASVSLSSIEKIRAASRGLPPKLKGIAEHITSEPGDIIHLSIVELAKKTASSEATIFRLCKRLGFEGFQDLKIAIAQEIDQTKPDYVDEEMSLDDDTAVFMQKVFQANISALKDSFQLLNPEDVEKAIKIIHEAKRLEFYGSGVRPHCNRRFS